MTDTQWSNRMPSDGPQGIAGWLILPIIGLILTPVQALIQLAQYPEIFENFPYLNAGQRIFVVVELAVSLAIAIAMPVYLLYLAFNKKTAFPRTYVIWAVANIAFIVADLVAAKILFGAVLEAAGVELIDSDTRIAILRAVILVGIWVPYMLNSRRVKNTFIY